MTEKPNSMNWFSVLKRDGLRDSSDDAAEGRRGRLNGCRTRRRQRFFNVSNDVQGDPSELVNGVGVLVEGEFVAFKGVLAGGLVGDDGAELELGGDDVVLGDGFFGFGNGVEHAAVLVLAHVEGVLGGFAGASCGFQRLDFY